MQQFRNLVPLSVVICILLGGNAVASVYPEGFEEFFTPVEKKVKIRNLDGTFTHEVPLQVKYDQIQLDEGNTVAIKQMEQYLLDNSVSATFVRPILNALIEGVVEQGLCAGNKRECSLHPEQFQWVQNFNENELYLFVNSSVLDYSHYSEDKQYYSPLSTENGLINSFDLYASHYNEQSSSVSLNNATTFGLPYGYLNADFSLSNNGNSELYEASYHLDADAFVFRAGTFEYSPSFNSTDFLNSGYRLPHHAIYFGSSKNLLVGGDRSNKSISFYAPQSGNVEVYRDGRLIYQRSVNEGHNTLSYKNLPSGRYEITVHVVSNGNIVDRQTYQIYNTASDSLAAGDIDYLLSGGVFSESFYDYDEKTEMAGDFFARGQLAYRPFDSTLLGVGGLLSNEASMLSTGASVYWLQADLSSDVTFNLFEDADYLNFMLGVSNFSMSYEKLNNQNNNPLASFLFGHESFERVSFNASYSLIGGRTIYATYGYYDTSRLEHDEFYVESDDYSTVTVGFSTPSVVSSYLNIYADYSDLNDELSMSLTWSVPLSDDVDVLTGINRAQDGLTQFSNTIRKEQLWDIDDLNTSLELGNTYDRSRNKNYQTVSLSANGNSDIGRMNINAYAGTDTNTGVSLGISSTQVVTKDDVYLTNDKSNSYAVIDVDHVRETDDNSYNKGYVSLRKDDRQNRRFMVSNDETLIPLTDYAPYQTNFDAESVELYNSGESQLKVFSHPGSVAVLNPKVSRVVSFVSAFSDLNEQAVEDITCQGDGCLNVAEMVEGVYKVTVLEGLSFELTAAQNTCLLPYELSSTTQMNFGNNYCLPLDDEGASHIVSAEGEELKIYFLGAFSPTAKFERTVSQLEGLGYEVIIKPVGELSAVYISQQPEYFDELFASSQELIKSVKELAIAHYKLDAIAYADKNN